MVVSHLVTQSKDDNKICTEIDTDMGNTMLGYALVNFANLEAKLVFQRDNPRHLNMAQVAAIYKFIAADGLQNKNPDHVMIAVYDDSCHRQLSSHDHGSCSVGHLLQ
jgi:hypothetical protein